MSLRSSRRSNQITSRGLMTIRFRDEWMDYPSAVIHYETRNESFLRLAEILHTMGISNCAFHLALIDESLKDLDPHDVESLTEAQKHAILIESTRNFWYFVREVARVDEPGNTTGGQFKANRSNIAFFWLYFCHITTIYTVIRQSGKSTSLLVLLEWLLNGGTVGSHIGMLTKDGALKSKTMAQLKGYFEYLPDYMVTATKRDVFNSEICNIDSIKNTVVGLVSNSSPKLAEKVGRGFTISTLLIDEIAFIENIEIALSAISMSGNAARTFHKESGKPYGTLMATTAGDIDGRDGKFVYMLICNSAPFTEIMYDCIDEEDLIDLVFTNSTAKDPKLRKLMVSLSFSHRQMGLTDEWMKEKLRDVQSTDENIERDMFNKWLSGSGASPIPEAARKIMQENEADEPRIEIFAPYNYIIRWFVDESSIEESFRNGHHLAVGIDTSDTIGKDDTTMYARDHATGEIVMSARFNETNLITLAEFFVGFLVRYPKSTFIIERRSSAPAIIDYLIKRLLVLDINPYDRLYNTLYQNKEKYAKEIHEIKTTRYYDSFIFDKYSAHIGFKTSGNGVTSRDQLFSTTLLMMMKYTAHLLRCPLLIDQLLGLVIRNERVDHAPGNHDDAVVAALLSFWILISGKNLDLYGFSISLLLKRNTVYLTERFESDSGSKDRERMEATEKEINDLLEAMKTEPNPVIIDQLERRVRFLGRNIKENSRHISVDSMLEEIHKTRRLTLR